MPSLDVPGRICGDVMKQHHCFKAGKTKLYHVLNAFVVNVYISPSKVKGLYFINIIYELPIKILLSHVSANVFNRHVVTKDIALRFSLICFLFAHVSQGWSFVITEANRICF